MVYMPLFPLLWVGCWGLGRGMGWSARLMWRVRVGAGNGAGFGADTGADAELAGVAASQSFAMVSRPPACQEGRGNLCAPARFSGLGAKRRLGEVQ